MGDLVGCRGRRIKGVPGGPDDPRGAMGLSGNSTGFSVDGPRSTTRHICVSRGRGDGAENLVVTTSLRGPSSREPVATYRGDPFVTLGSVTRVTTSSPVERIPLSYETVHQTRPSLPMDSPLEFQRVNPTFS